MRGRSEQQVLREAKQFSSEMKAQLELNALTMRKDTDGPRLPFGSHAKSIERAFDPLEPQRVEVLVAHAVSAWTAAPDLLDQGETAKSVAKGLGGPQLITDDTRQVTRKANWRQRLRLIANALAPMVPETTEVEEEDRDDVSVLSSHHSEPAPPPAEPEMDENVARLEAELQALKEELARQAQNTRDKEQDGEIAALKEKVAAMEQDKRIQEQLKAKERSEAEREREREREREKEREATTARERERERELDRERAREKEREREGLERGSERHIDAVKSELMAQLKNLESKIEESKTVKAENEREKETANLRESFELKSQLDRLKIDRLESALSERPQAESAKEEAAAQERMTRVERDVEAIRDMLTKQPHEHQKAMSEHTQRAIQGAMDSLKAELESIKDQTAHANKPDPVHASSHQQQLASHNETQERVARIDARLDALHEVLKESKMQPESGELSPELKLFMEQVKRDLQTLNAKQAEQEAASARRELEIANQRISEMDGKLDTLKREVTDGLKDSLREHAATTSSEMREHHKAARDEASAATSDLVSHVADKLAQFERENDFNRTRELDERARTTEREASANDSVVVATLGELKTDLAILREQQSAMQQDRSSMANHTAQINQKFEALQKDLAHARANDQKVSERA